MLLTFAAGATGLLVGLWFRVPALIAASVTSVALCLLAAPFAELGLAATTGTILAVLSALQGGYLAGLMLSCMWSRFPRPGYDYLQAVIRSPLRGADSLK